MTPRDPRDMLVIVHRADGSGALDKRTVCLPAEAGVSDLLDELERVAPDMHVKVRNRILRAAGRVLAYGQQSSLLPTLSRQLAEGGPIIFPAEDDPVGSRTLGESPCLK